MVHSWKVAQGCWLGSLPSKAIPRARSYRAPSLPSPSAVNLHSGPLSFAPGRWGRWLRMRDDTRVLLAPHSGGLWETLASGRTESHLCHSLLADPGSGTLPFKGLSFLTCEMVVMLPASHYRGEDCYLLQGMLAVHQQGLSYRLCAPTDPSTLCSHKG